VTVNNPARAGVQASVRALAIVPPLVVGVFLVAWLMAPATARDPLLVVEIETSKALAIYGCAAAALVFEPGDHLRRAWLLLACCTLLLLGRDVVALALHPGPGDTATFGLQAALATAGNGCSVVGTWMLARTWRVAGLEGEPDERGNTLLVLAIVAAVLATGWPVVSDVRSLAHGSVFAVVPLASDLADAAVVVLLAPLAGTALALRGGALLWPWVFLTATGTLWIVFDVTYGAITLTHVDPGTAHVALETLRALATFYAFAAGMAQKKVLVVSPAAP
jgi:hypothetical protein